MRIATPIPLLIMACQGPDKSGRDSGEDSGVDSIAVEAGLFENGEAWGVIDTTDDDPARREQNPMGIADFNGDGLDDLILGKRGVGLVVHLNRGEVFEQIQTLSITDPSGIAIGDIDNDGDLDLWSGGHVDQMHLYENDGMGGFSDISELAGIAQLPTVPQKMDGVFGDFDQDGDLDLFINRAGLMQNTPDTRLDLLLQNEGDGRFEDVSSWLPDQWRTGMGWSSLWADFDDDGDLDLYTVNSDQGFYGPSRLLINEGSAQNGSWTFSSGEMSCYCTHQTNPMGASAADWNNDGWLDLFLTNTGENTLLQNFGDGSFTDMTFSVGSMGMGGSNFMTYGAAWFDWDHDGWLDLFAAAGPLHDGNSFPQEEEAQPDFFWKGDGQTLVDMAPVLGVDSKAAGRAVSVGLITGDNHLDVMVSNLGAKSLLYESRQTDRPALIVSLDDSLGNRFGLGARIRLTTDDGLVQLREISTKPGWGAGSHPRAHFGLGDATPETLEVRWLGQGWQIVDLEGRISGRMTIER